MKAIRVHEGSAKDTKIYQEPAKTETGVGGFKFKPYFSLFDKGIFKDSPITYKDIAMKIVAMKNFDLLNDAGIRNHYHGLNKNGEMEIDVVRIPEAYTNVPIGSINYLLPVEIIFREFTHPASSDLKKIKKGEKTWQELGYDGMPEPNKRLLKVKISYSTKLEDEDRVLTRNEAQIIAGLTNKEMDELEELALSVNEIITKHAAKIGLIHYDGKIEVAKDSKGRFTVVDVFGTLDEDRFMMQVGNGIYVDVSKQFLRNYYTIEGYKAKTDAAKDRAQKEHEHDWTIFCPEPPQLPGAISILTSDMYVATAKEWAPEYNKMLAEGLVAGSPEVLVSEFPDLNSVPLLSSVAKDLYVAERIHEALKATGRGFDDIYDAIRVRKASAF